MLPNTIAYNLGYLIDIRFAGIPGILPYNDDILIMGHSETYLDRNVRAGLSRFWEYGLHLKFGKCVYHRKNIEFLVF